MTTYRGTPVSEGTAAGELYRPDAPPGTDRDSGAEAAAGGTAAVTVTGDDVRAAFAAVAVDRNELADRLRSAGRRHEADIVQIGAMMAADPALSGPALDALPGSGPYAAADAVAAVAEAAEAQAAILAALPVPELAQRAGDVRQVAAAVIARLRGTAASCAGSSPPPAGPFILVQADVDPADLIRLADTGSLVGAASVGGGATSHAAIIARGLGLPMLAGTDPAVLTAPAGHRAVLDAVDGELRIEPAPTQAGAADGAPVVPALTVPVPGAARTTDGELVTILCNVASAAETRLGLANGAAGVGLLRTEIPFTRAAGWPARAEHLATLTPVLGLLRGRRAVVRLLDFAGDKVPPFPGAAGLPAFLAAPGALAAQLAAILEAGSGTDLAVMIPMVRNLDEVQHVRAALDEAAKAAGMDPPPLGMMVELDATARAAPAFAGAVDFFSIGTNDLTADVLGRERSALSPADAAHPQVLTVVGIAVRAAARAGIGVSVCGDAAAERAVLPALLSLGVRTVSVGAAKVPAVAGWITQTDTRKRRPGDAG